MTVEQARAAIDSAMAVRRQPNDLKLAKEPRNDIGNARRLIARHGDDLRHVDEAGWYFWDERCWQPTIGQRGGPGPEVLKRAHATTEAITSEAEAVAREAPPAPAEDDNSPAAKQQREHRESALSTAQAHWKFGIGSGNAAKIDGMLKAAAPYRRCRPYELDAHPLLFNAQNGTLDLGGDLPVLRPARREDLLTQASPISYDPEVSAPSWRAFLDRILPGRPLQLFLQTWCGYCLTGLTVEQKLVLLYGTGANGKSALLNAISHVLGSYALTTPIETFIANDRRGGDPTPDIARLSGSRVVMASEPETGARLAESVVKIATGGDKMVARRLFEGQFEFAPVFKLMISANTRPTIRGQDEGIWRRVLLLPFEVFIPEAERDRELPRKLQAEGAGILNWMIDGWLLYRESGLVIPEAMREATDSYRAESDPVREFLSLRTERVPGQRVTAAALYNAYAKWAIANALEPGTKASFGRRASNVGLKREKVGVFYYRDLALLPDDEADDAGPPDDSRVSSDGEASVRGPGGSN